MIRPVRRADGRLRFVKLIALDRAHLDSIRRMRDDWRDGVSLEPSQPPWANGAGVALRWDD